MSTIGSSQGELNRVGRILVLALLFGAFPLLSARAASGGPAPDSLLVIYRGRSEALPLKNLDGYACVSIEALKRAIGGGLEWDPSGQDVTLRYGGGVFRFEDGIPFFSFDRRPYQLVHPPVPVKDDFLVPVQFPSEYLPYFFPDVFSFDHATFTLRGRLSYTLLDGIKRSSKGTGTAVFISASSPPRFDVDSSRPGTLLLNVFESEAAEQLADSIRGFGCIDSVQVLESGGSTQFLFFLNSSVRHYRVAEVRTPPGIRISFSAVRPVESRPPAADHDLVSGMIDPKTFRIKTIVIDPGHGGKDPGAIGRDGLKEKDVNLAVALKLADLLKKETNFNVILTRKKDRYISLGDRTKIANSRKADLFVSIHCNATRKRKTRGFEAYFLSAAKTDEERAVALRENLSVKFDRPPGDSTSLDDLQFIFLDLAQNEYLRESSDMAEMMCREFQDGPGVHNRGVRQAGFFVLNGAYMPSILLELGYISNPAEERLLRSSKYQSEVAEKICRGLQGYAARYNQKIGKAE